VLAAEAAGRVYGDWGRQLTWRYGAMGHGLLGLPEHGIPSATIEQLRALVALRFTGGNAVLSLNGPPPAGLRLALPPGPGQAPPSRAPALLKLPGWFADEESGGVSASATLPREAAASVYCALAGDRLHARLRLERALSYAPGVAYEPFTADRAHLLLYADSDRPRRVELAAAFTEVLEGLEEVGEAETEATRDRWVDAVREGLETRPDDAAGQEARSAAGCWILGRRWEPVERIMAEVAAVTAAEVASVGRAARGEALLALPRQAPPRPWLGSRAPISTVPAVEGREVANVDAPVRPPLLIHSLAGVTLRHACDEDITVRYTHLGAGLAFGDGAVTLIGRDGTHLVVEPTLWRDGARLCEEIKARVPPALLLQRAARPADAIPRPATTAWQRLTARARRLGLGLGSLALVVVFLVVVMLAVDRGAERLPLAPLAWVGVFLAAMYLQAASKKP
jgi:hypothetical protein